MESCIRLVIIDVDGTLTDGIYLVSSDGSTTKGYHTHDFWAMQRLQEMGIAVAIVTHCYDNSIDVKINDLPEESRPLLTLAKLDWQTTKEDFIEEFRKSFNPRVSWSEIAFMGDSLNDLEAMKRCAITGCPADAMSMIVEESNFIANAPGGRGAVHEFAEFLIEADKNGYKHYRSNNQSETEVVVGNAEEKKNS